MSLANFRDSTVGVEVKMEDMEFDGIKTEEPDLVRMKTGEDHLDWFAVKKEDPEPWVKSEDLAEVKEEPDLMMAKREEAGMMNVKHEYPVKMEDSYMMQAEDGEPADLRSLQLNGGHASHVGHDAPSAAERDYGPTARTEGMVSEDGEVHEDAPPILQDAQISDAGHSPATQGNVSRASSEDKAPPLSAGDGIRGEVEPSGTELDTSDLRFEQSSELSVLSCLLCSPTLERFVSDKLSDLINGEAPNLTPAPVIHVEGMGILPLPLVDATAAQLAALCVPLQPASSRTFALSPSKFTITNPKWQEGLEKLMKVVSKRLGCGDEGLPVTLRKMVLHEPGAASDGRWWGYQDTEPEDEVLATLVVQLLSSYEGGQLVLRKHDSTESIYGLEMFNSAQSVYMNHYAVHVADSQHRVANITKGHCLMLLYSIHVPTTATKPQNFPMTAKKRDANVIDELQLLKSPFWFPFARKYGEENLRQNGIKALRGMDRELARTLDQPMVTVSVVQVQRIRAFRDGVAHPFVWTTIWKKGRKAGKVPTRGFTGQLNMINPHGLSDTKLWGDGASTQKGSTSDSQLDRAFTSIGLMVEPQPKNGNSNSNHNGTSGQEHHHETSFSVNDKDALALLAILKEASSTCPRKVKLDLLTKIGELGDVDALQKAVEYLDFNTLAIPDFVGLSKEKWWLSLSSMIAAKGFARN
ncbi:hypothetical protein HDU96_002964 [Phlyctochytrium bullatum]|nr:hypothetical protein HDU96_002964 [Phlyctochytrium bullatum]